MLRSDATLSNLGMDQLLAAGFTKVAIWRRGDTGEVRCEGAIPAAAGIYMFATSGNVRYVGAATNLRGRMQSYERRQSTPVARRPVHPELAKALEGGGEIEVYALELDQSAQLDWKGLPVHPILGLEAGLIVALNPAWSRRGRKLTIDTDAIPPS